MHFLTWFRDVISSQPPLGVVLPRSSVPKVLVDRSALSAGALQSAAFRAAALAKVTHASRVQRAQAGVERHQLGRSRLQRQNCARQRSERHRSHTHSNSYLQQPGCHSQTHWAGGYEDADEQLGCDNKVMNPAHWYNFFVQLQTNQSMWTLSPQQYIKSNLAAKILWSLTSHGMRCQTSEFCQNSEILLHFKWSWVSDVHTM